MNTLTRPADIPAAPAAPPWDFEVLRVFYEAGRADARAELTQAGS